MSLWRCKRYVTAHRKAALHVLPKPHRYQLLPCCTKEARKQEVKRVFEPLFPKKRPQKKTNTRPTAKGTFAILLRHAVDTLPLHLVEKIIVALVKVVNADVAVLSATGVALAGWVSGDGVEGAEVTANTADLILEDLVVEAGFEFTLAGGGAGDVHGGLATTEDDKVLLRGHGGAVEGGVGDVGLDDLKVSGGDELCDGGRC